MMRVFCFIMSIIINVLMIVKYDINIYYIYSILDPDYYIRFRTQLFEISKLWLTIMLEKTEYRNYCLFVEAELHSNSLHT